MGSTTLSHYAMRSGSLHADVWDHLRRVRLPGWRAPRGAPTELVYRRVSQTNPADSARTTPIWTPHLAAIYVTARTQLLPSANSTNHHLRPGLGEIESAIGCLYPDAQARVALADLIRHFLRTSGCNQMAIKWLILHPLMQPASSLCRQPNRSLDKVNAYGGPR